MMRPSSTSIAIVAGFAIAGLLIACGRIYVDYHELDNDFWVATASTLWLTIFCGFLVIAIIDSLRYQHLRAISGRRKLPRSLSLNRHHQVVYTIGNGSKVAISFRFYDLIPDHMESSAFPLRGHCGAQQSTAFSYDCVPKQRGDGHFQRAQIVVNSRWNLWNFIRRFGHTSDSRVYPDFSVINTTSLLTIERTMSLLGAHLSQRRGDGMEFHQLREFRIGDTLRQVDWKATARLNKPISREYQEEKDQYLIFLLDSSRRMRAKEDNVSYFDHALNALLANSYIALGKGDGVGVMTFAGDHRWLSPVKGKTGVNRLLNHLYHVETSTDSSDYITAAEALLHRHRKRSLVVIITNLHDEDHQDIGLATRLLTSHHLVMVVALQERLLSDIHQRPVRDIDSAMLYSGVALFSQARKKTLARLQASGIVVVDATWRNMHVKLLHEYLQLKRLGKI